MRFVDRTRALLPGLALVALTCLVYSSSLRGELVFDDLLHVANNPFVRDLSLFAHPERAVAAGAEPLHLHALRMRPLAYLTLAFDYRLHGLDVVGYHLVNLAIHVVAGLLLFRLVRRTLALPAFARSALAPRRDGVAFIAAGCFLLHPLQTQAVSYVVQRMTSLAAMLCLLALVSYVEARLAERLVWRGSLYGLSLLALSAAMFTKENAATFPLVVLLYELAFLTGPWLQRLAGLVPHLLTAAMVPLRVAAAAGAPAATGGGATSLSVDATLPRFDYLVTQLSVVAGYLRLVVWPVGQNVDHDPAVYGSVWHLPVVLSFALLASIVASAIQALRRPWRGEPAWRLVGFGGLWFFLALAVESSVVPIADLMVEHRLYLPLAGVAIAAATAAGVATAGWSRDAVRSAAAVLLALLGVITFARNRVWQSPAALWTDSLRKSPGKSRPLNNVGIVRELDGRLDEAIELYQRAVTADGRNFEARFNLGNALAKRGRDEEAARALLGALTLVPTSARAHERLLDVLTLAALRAPREAPEAGAEEAGPSISPPVSPESADRAIAAVEARLVESPGDGRIWSWLGELYLARGWPAPAARCLAVAVRRLPDDAHGHRLLGETLARLGRQGEARAMLRRAGELIRSQSVLAEPQARANVPE